ncbi:MAG: metallopeptidase family protein [Pseudomonadota bacterium]
MEDDLFPPDLAEFEAMAAEAFDALPRAFRDRCGTVAIRVADFADEETLREMEIADPFELTGLYSGAPLTEKSEADVAPPPDQVWLYRRPILDEWAERGDTGIYELVAHVLVHEIGHHFGLTDEEIDAIEARAAG